MHLINNKPVVKFFQCPKVTIPRPSGHALMEQLCQLAKPVRFLFALALFISLLFGPVVLAADGDLDTTFGTDGIVTTAIGSTGSVGEAIAMQEDGKIVVVGWTWSFSDIAVVRYNSDGTLDTNFSGDGKLTTDIGSTDKGNDVAIQSDGKIVVAGASSADFAVVRYNSDGTLDTSFSGDGKLTTDIGSTDSGQAVAVQSDGKIVVAGYSNNGSNYDFAVVRYNSDGTLDTTFSGDGKLTTAIGSDHDFGEALAIQSDGKIVVAGRSNNGSDDDFAVVRYNSDGTLDTSFDGDGKLTTDLGDIDSGYAVAIQSDGKIVVAGYTWRDGIAVVRYNSDGTLDTNFSGDGIATNGDGRGNAVAIQSDNKIVVAGYVWTSTDTDIIVARYNSDGTLDTSFSGDGQLTTSINSANEIGKAVAIQSDGKIVVAGNTWNGSSYDFAVVRYESGAADTLTVNTTDDELNSDGDCSLREAIQAANTDSAVDACLAGSGDDTITLPAGTYTLSLAGANEDNNQTGDLDIKSNLTINGAGAASTIIDANEIDRVLEIHSGYTVEINEVKITNGKTPSSGTNGGGIYNKGTLTLSDSTISNNFADYEGGGIYNYNATLTISGSTISDNTADYEGGGIHNYNATLTISGSTISNNTADHRGGGIQSDAVWGDSTATLNISNSTISGNNANHVGGGINNHASYDNTVATLNISNSTISGNTTNYSGGGIGNDASHGNAMAELNINHSTIANNTTDSDNNGSGDGGGIYNDSGNTTNLKNTIIASNSDNGGQANDCSGTLDSYGYNLIQNTSGCTFNDVQNSGTNITGQEALLGSLANNGGSTETHALLDGSPAIDAGSCTDIDNNTVTTDQRGEARPQGASCDIGAFETGGAMATATPSQTPTLTQTATRTATSTPTNTPQPTVTPSQTPTVTQTATRTATSTPTMTPQPTVTPGGPTFTPSQTPTLTSTATRTRTHTPTNTPTRTQTAIQTPTQTNTPILTATSTQTETPTRTPTATSSPSHTPQPTVTPGGPTLTPSQTPTLTSTATQMLTSTQTNTPHPTLTTDALTQTPKATLTHTNTPLPDNGDYEPNDECEQAQPITSDGTVQDHTFQDAGDVDWSEFEAISGTTYLVEAQTPSDSTADVTLAVYDECGTFPTFGQDETFTPDIRLSFTAPQDGPLYLKLSHYDPDVGGTDKSYRLSVRALSDSVSPGALVLVAGRIRANDALQNHIHRVTNNVYRIFQSHGYDSERIFYLAPDMSLDADGDTFSDVDAQATNQNLRLALTDSVVNLVGPDRALTLYLMDHGSEDVFFLNGRSDTVTPQELDQWLEEVEEVVPGLQVNIFLEACHSGSFLNGISKPGRVVMASTGRYAVAYASPQGAVFSDALLSALDREMSLYGAFSEAQMVVQEAHPDQTPWMDDDGDGIPNEGADGLIAQQRGFAYVGTLPNDKKWPPYIADVELLDFDGERGLIRADVRDDVSVLQAWAVIYKPSYVPPNPDETEEIVREELPTVTLLDSTGQGIYSAVYEGFNEPGTYRIVVYAYDGEGIEGRPLAIETQIGSNNYFLYLPAITR